MSTSSPSYFAFKATAVALLAFIIAGLYIYSNTVTGGRTTATSLFSANSKLIPKSDRRPLTDHSWIPPLNHSQKPSTIRYINYWAQWCRPCVIELPLLAKLEEELAGRVVFTMINVDEDPSDLSEGKQFARSLNTSFQWIYENTEAISYVKEMGQLPLHEIIDRRGRVALKFAGDIEGKEQRLKELLLQLIAEP